MQRTTSELMRGNLDLMVLSVISEERRYGYSIQQRLTEVSAGLVKVQAGTLYPLLHKLEAEKLVRARWDKSTGRKRKWYEITATGRRRLAHQASQWQQYADCVRKLLEPVLQASPVSS